MYSIAVTIIFTITGIDVFTPSVFILRDVFLSARPTLWRHVGCVRVCLWGPWCHDLAGCTRILYSTATNIFTTTRIDVLTSSACICVTSFHLLDQHSGAILAVFETACGGLGAKMAGRPT